MVCSLEVGNNPGGSLYFRYDIICAPTKLKLVLQLLNTTPKRVGEPGTRASLQAADNELAVCNFRFYLLLRVFVVSRALVNLFIKHPKDSFPLVNRHWGTEGRPLPNRQSNVSSRSRFLTTPHSRPLNFNLAHSSSRLQPLTLWPALLLSHITATIANTPSCSH